MEVMKWSLRFLKDKERAPIKFKKVLKFDKNYEEIDIKKEIGRVYRDSV